MLRSDGKITNIKEKKVIFPLILYMALKPIYLFESGGIQISDVVLLFAIVADIVNSGGRIRLSKMGSEFRIVLIGVVLYQFIVNLLWYFNYPDSRLLMSSAFYIYNTIALFYFVSIARKYGNDVLKKSIIIGIIISELVSLMGVVLNRGQSVRGTGFFNNPNQLGLHGLLMISLLFFTTDYTNVFIRYSIAIIAVLLIFVSASKAALLALFVYAFFYVIFVDKKSTTKSLIRKIALLILVAILSYLFFYSSNSTISSNQTIMYMRYRILNMSRESDSNLATGRGYARILEMGYNLMWGMGEGAYDRFQIMYDHEVHSMIANIFVSYGVIGMIGYIIVHTYLLVDKKRTLYNIAGYSGLFLYGISHNSIRNTLLWMVFALLYINKYNDSGIKECS